MPGIGVYQRYHTSSQSSTIQNFRSANYTESHEKDAQPSLNKNKTAKVMINMIYDNMSSSQQKMSNEKVPNRPKTSIKTGIGKAANKFAYTKVGKNGQNAIQAGWNTQR